MGPLTIDFESNEASKFNSAPNITLISTIPDSKMDQKEFSPHGTHSSHLTKDIQVSGANPFRMTVGYFSTSPDDMMEIATPSNKALNTH